MIRRPMTLDPMPFDAVFVGDINVYSKGLTRLRALKKMVGEVWAVPHTPIGDDKLGHPQFSLLYRICYRFGHHLDTEDANRNLIDSVGRLKPRLVWIEKGTMIRPATLRRIKELSLPPTVVSYSDDDMALRHNHTDDYVMGLRYYDCVFTTKPLNCRPDELPAMGARRVVMVDKAFDPDTHFPIPLSDDDRRDFGAECGFIGSFEAERAEAMLYLARNGVPVRVWGNGWAAMVGVHPNMTVENRPVVNTPIELRFTKAVAATRINLGFLRKLNRDTQTDRSVEIPACGGFMLAERSDDHRRLFEEDKEAVFFSSPEDMLEKARYYLANEAERLKIAAAGRARCVAADYSHAARVRFMLEQAFST